MPSKLAGPINKIPQWRSEDVRRWRQEHGLSIRQMAVLLGMTGRNVSIWESGERGDPPWYASAVLHYVDCEHAGTA
jgi:DNA-binding transcriptional regulator YiaG